MAEIVVEDVRAEGDVLRSTLSISRDLQRFFRNDEFRVEYPVTVEGLPDAILTIPILAQVCPVAWARGGTVRVGTVDTRFRSSLEDVEETFRSMYPEFMQGGTLLVDEEMRVEPPQRPADRETRTAQFFTGGVDSMATYLRTREANPAFVTVNGWTEPYDDPGWPDRVAALGRYSDRFGLDHHFLRSNMLSLLDHTMLIAEYKRYLLGSWYSAVGHGLGLLGISAPLAYARGIERIVVAATYSETYDHRWGSNPSIVNDVRWTGTHAEHDGFDLTRQQKIERIAAFADEEWPDLPLDTCNDDIGENCGTCEKCIRTSIGLVLAGRDPERHGYPFGPETFEVARRRIEHDEWNMDETGCYWRDLQNHVRYDVEFPVEGAESFFRWLETVDFKGLSETATAPRRDRLVRFAARNVPYPVYASLYPRYNAFSNVLRR